jgi:hypothetical protein
MYAVRSHAQSRFPTLALLLVLGWVVACGESGAGPNGGGGTAPPPTRTGTGTAIGAPVSQSIGPAGGTLSSSSSALSIMVPPGALAAANELTIQAITAVAPGAVGPAWRLGPEGVQFAAPITVTFTYDDVMLEGSAPELAWIAYQEADGAWRYADEVTLDSMAGTLSVQTTHFSDWTLVVGLQIRPGYTEVDPGADVDLEVKNCMTQVEGPIYAYECVTFDFGDEDELPALPSRNNPQGSVDVSSWAVNGDVGGSGIYGLVFGSTGGGTLGTALYRAPTATPEDRNPVAVSVDVRDGRNRRVATLVANILIRGQLPTIHVVGGVDRAFVPIAIFIGADVSDRVEFDMVLRADGGIDFENIQNFPSSYTNPRLPPDAAPGYCSFTVDSPFELGTYTEFSGGNSGLDSAIVQFRGQGTLAASSYFVRDNNGNCLGPISYPAISGTTVPSTFDFDRTLFDRVGVNVVVLGYDLIPGNLDGWAFSLRRTR